MEYSDDDFLMISGIQHFVFCKRQWALDHIENSWEDNYLTVTGQELHSKVDNPYLKESRNTKFIERAMKVRSNKMGLTGICDVDEFIKDDDNGVEIFGKIGKYLPVPVEYKRGTKKETHADELQLLAEGICLEEMLFCHLDYGYLYYGKERHREKVEFSQGLREELGKTVMEMHGYWSKKYTPKVKPGKKCDSCSLKNICLPELLIRESVEKYMKRVLEK